MARIRAVLDANALVPVAVRDTLLRAAEAGLYQPFWSRDILDETERTVARLLTEAGSAEPEPRAKRAISQMRGAFPAAEVIGYADLLQELRVDPKDRHVLAAAIASQSQQIVTNNLRHFPLHALAPYQVEAVTPDRFLCRLFDLDSDLLITILRQQSAALQRPAYTLRELLDRLGRSLPHFIALVRQQIARQESVDPSS